MFSIFTKKEVDSKKTDLKLIEVNSSGGFYMSSKNIFNDKEESLKLISEVEKAVKKYQAKTVEHRVKKR